MGEKPAHGVAELFVVDCDELCSGDEANSHRARFEVPRQPVRDRVAYRHLQDVAGRDRCGDPTGLA